MSHSPGFFKRTLYRIIQQQQFTQLIILTSFELSFGLVRLVTYLQKIEVLPNQGGPLHIHHLVPGILLSLLGGYLGLTFWHRSKMRYLAAGMFGVGAALTLDEFALWLNLKDVYWEEQGRISIDAVIITTVFLLVAYLISEAHEHEVLKFLRRSLTFNNNES